MYRCWTKDEFDDCKDADERVETGWVVPAESGIFDSTIKHRCTSVDEAARKFADRRDSNGDSEDVWPQDFVIHDGEKYYAVSVQREYVPEFWPDDPVEIEVKE